MTTTTEHAQVQVQVPPAREAAKADNAVEPLLPVEKKLIGWSLGLGIVLLVLLSLVARYSTAG